MTEELKPHPIAAQSAPAGEREAFEAYSQSIGYTLKVGDSGRYIGGYGAELWSGFKAGAAWQRAQSAPVVPEGWRLVPLEPTEEMIDAGCREHTCVQGDSWYSDSEISEHDAIAVFKAMLAAAPQPAAQELCNCPGGNKPEPHKHAPNCPYRAGAAARQEQGDVVVTRNAAGQIVAVTRQDEEGRILSVIAEADPAGKGDEVRRLREAVARADEVLAALTACTTPLDRLERKFGEDWCQSVDKVRSELIAALSAQQMEGK